MLVREENQLIAGREHLFAHTYESLTVTSLRETKQNSVSINRWNMALYRKEYYLIWTDKAD